MFNSRWSRKFSGSKEQQQGTLSERQSLASDANAKIQVSDQLGILLWLPVTIGLVPVTPSVVVGSKWMGKYLGSRQVGKRRELVEK